jgi:hypothetical protein
MAKRAGRGHDDRGILGTKCGELAVPCRACPLPGINLPENWKESDEKCVKPVLYAVSHICSRWIYSLLLSEDANFKQKGRVRRNDGKDPPLGPGWATFVDPKPYYEFISANTHETEVCGLDFD